MDVDMTFINNMMSWAFKMYAKTAESAVPIAVAFGIGNLLVSTFLRVAFGGKLKFGGSMK